jgi:hypothetical protein
LERSKEYILCVFWERHTITDKVFFNLNGLLEIFIEISCTHINNIKITCGKYCLNSSINKCQHEPFYVVFHILNFKTFQYLHCWGSARKNICPTNFRIVFLCYSKVLIIVFEVYRNDFLLNHSVFHILNFKTFQYLHCWGSARKNICPTCPKDKFRKHFYLFKQILS